MIRYSSDQDNAGIAWTAALAAALASILLVRWLAHVSALAFAGLAAAVVVALLVSWVIFPSRKLPPYMAQQMRLRARCRLHPGRGHATVFELWLCSGRMAAGRRARPSRPSQSLLEWLFCPAQTSVEDGTSARPRPRAWDQTGLQL